MTNLINLITTIENLTTALTTSILNSPISPYIVMSLGVLVILSIPTVIILGNVLCKGCKFDGPFFWLSRGDEINPKCRVHGK